MHKLLAGKEAHICTPPPEEWQGCKEGVGEASWKETRCLSAMLPVRRAALGLKVLESCCRARGRAPPRPHAPVGCGAR